MVFDSRVVPVFMLRLPKISGSSIVYFSQKQLPREMEPRLVIIVCAGYIFWQLCLRQLYIIANTNPIHRMLVCVFLL